MKTLQRKKRILSRMAFTFILPDKMMLDQCARTRDETNLILKIKTLLDVSEWVRQCSNSVACDICNLATQQRFHSFIIDDSCSNSNSDSHEKHTFSFGAWSRKRRRKKFVENTATYIYHYFSVSLLRLIHSNCSVINSIGASQCVCASKFH